MRVPWWKRICQFPEVLVQIELRSVVFCAPVASRRTARYVTSAASAAIILHSRPSTAGGAYVSVANNSSVSSRVQTRPDEPNSTKSCASSPDTCSRLRRTAGFSSSSSSRSSSALVDASNSASIVIAPAVSDTAQIEPECARTNACAHRRLRSSEFCAGRSADHTESPPR